MKGWNKLFGSKSKDPFVSMYAEHGNLQGSFTYDVLTKCPAKESMRASCSLTLFVFKFEDFSIHKFFDDLVLAMPILPCILNISLLHLYFE